MRIFTCALILTTLTFPALAQEPPRRDSVIYEPSLEDPVLKEIRTRNEKADKDRDARTTVIRARQKADQKARKDARKKLRATLPENEVPASPEIFTRHFHFPPQAQYYTGTCWAYGATSLLESEIFRIADKKIKMSEMHTVYYEYIEKTRRFVQERGDSNFAEGSQHNAVTRMWKLYGAVPLEVYAGVLAEDGLHDHTRMSREMTDFLQHVKAKDVWDEEWVVGVIRSILDKYMGPPPTEFKYKGRQYTPLSFLEKVCKINPDDYLGFMSSMAHPFYSQSEFEVPDNWWKDASYHNVPIEVFMGALTAAVKAGFTVGIGGDVSEPGKNYRQDLMFVPTFDIPSQYIDQAAREYRIANHSTGDDHGIHLVGWKKIGDWLWFIIKDSGRSARHGKHAGFYFVRSDYIKLKMLTFTVHKDAVAKLLEEFKVPAPPDKQKQQSTGD